MENEILAFEEYLSNERGVSKNTKDSYRRDLMKMKDFFEKQGITDVSAINSANINTYLLKLGSSKVSPATIHRHMSSIRAFFKYEFMKGNIRKEPEITVSVIEQERKEPVILSIEEVELLLNSIDGDDEKSLRDKAMIELIYASGLKVSEITALKLSDVNMQLGYIICSSDKNERVIPFGDTTKKCIAKYIKYGRQKLIRDNDTDLLFTNCYGNRLSRQGCWKIIKEYAAAAGIDKEITPYSLRHSFAAHMVQNGADLHAVQEMLGHSGIASTQVYTKLAAKLAGSKLREVYKATHPHG